MPLVSSANRGYTVSPHDLKAHGLEGHGWYERVRQGGTERVFGSQLLGGCPNSFLCTKKRRENKGESDRGRWEGWMWEAVAEAAGGRGG